MRHLIIAGAHQTKISYLHAGLCLDTKGNYKLVVLKVEVDSDASCIASL